MRPPVTEIGTPKLLRKRVVLTWNKVFLFQDTSEHIRHPNDSL
jgi:hypothetical protein